MSAATIPDAVLSPEVRQFLRHHGAEGTFVNICDFVRECYPRMRSLEVELWTDPDEMDHRKVMLWVGLPASTSMEEYLAQRGRMPNSPLGEEGHFPQLFEDIRGI
jgi:hypothetical protein